MNMLGLALDQELSGRLVDHPGPAGPSCSTCGSSRWRRAHRRPGEVFHRRDVIQGGLCSTSTLRARRSEPSGGRRPLTGAAGDRDARRRLGCRRLPSPGSPSQIPWSPIQTSRSPVPAPGRAGPRRRAEACAAAVAAGSGTTVSMPTRRADPPEGMMNTAPGTSASSPHSAQFSSCWIEEQGLCPAREQQEHALPRH